MATLRIRMDDDLNRALAARAAQHNRSRGQETTAIIRESLGWPALSPREATEAFLAMAGTWADDRPADEIVRELRSRARIT